MGDGDRSIKIPRRFAFRAKEFLGRSFGDHMPAMSASARSDVENVVGLKHHVFVVLHNNYRVTQIAEILQRANEFNVIARVQPDTWLVEDVQDTYQLRTDLCCEAYALGFTATQRADGSV